MLQEAPGPQEPTSSSRMVSRVDGAVADLRSPSRPYKRSRAGGDPRGRLRDAAACDCGQIYPGIGDSASIMSAGRSNVKVAGDRWVKSNRPPLASARERATDRPMPCPSLPEAPRSNTAAESMTIEPRRQHLPRERRWSRGGQRHRTPAVAKSVVDQHIQNLGDQTPRDLDRADVGLDVDQ